MQNFQSLPYPQSNSNLYPPYNASYPNPRNQSHTQLSLNPHQYIPKFHQFHPEMPMPARNSQSPKKPESVGLQTSTYTYKMQNKWKSPTHTNQYTDHQPLPSSSFPYQKSTKDQRAKKIEFEKNLEEFLQFKKEKSPVKSNFVPHLDSSLRKNLGENKINHSYNSSFDDKFKLDFRQSPNKQPMNNIYVEPSPEPETKTLSQKQKIQKQIEVKENNQQTQLKIKELMPSLADTQKNSPNSNKIMNLNINTKYETNSNIDPHQISAPDMDSGKTPTFNNNSSLKINFSPSKNKQATSKSQMVAEQQKKPQKNASSISQYTSRSREPTPRKNDDQVSYTKYLLLEMKKEDLEKQIQKMKEQVKNKQEELKNKSKAHQEELGLYRKNLSDQKIKYVGEIDKIDKQLKQQKHKYENELQEQRKKNLESLYQKQKEYQKKQREMKVRYERIIEEKDVQIKKLFEKLTLADEEYREELRRTELLHLIEEIELKSQEQAENLARIQGLQKELQINEEQLSKFKQLNDKTLAYSYQLSKNLQETITLLNRTKAANPSFQQTINTQLTQAKLLNKKIEELHEEKLALKQKLQEQLRNMEKLHNEYKVQLVKQKSERNKEVTELNMIITNKDNEIKTLTQKLKTLENRYRIAISDNKNKDQFIYKYLISKCQKSDIVANNTQVRQSTERALKQLKNWLQLSEQIQSLKQDNKQLRSKIELCGL